MGWGGQSEGKTLTAETYHHIAKPGNQGKAKQPKAKKAETAKKP
jgi:hypothetical protein